MIRLLALLFLSLKIFSLEYAHSAYSKNEHLKSFLFINWLETHQKEFGKCHPKKIKGVYKLCDGTKIDAKELRELFSFTSEKLFKAIKDKGVKIVVFCSDKKRKGDFFNFCIKKSEIKTQNAKEFAKITSLHGQFKPETNTIYINSNVSPGTLIHEYIHYLQFKNTNEIFGKKYKSQRVDIQKDLVSKMDQIIHTVQEKEKNQDKIGVNQLVKKMVKLGQTLKSFSKWQDLIDERSIFELYLKFHDELKIKSNDLELAQKNMNHICRRQDLSKILDRKFCHLKKILKFEGEYYKSIKNMISDIRPKPEFDLINSYLDSLPKIPKGQKLLTTIKKLNTYIFEKIKMTPDTSYLSRNNKDNILPDSTLKLKHAHCVGLSTLYLLAFEQYKIKAGLVRLPSHVFIRACEKDKCHNIETLKKGKITSDQYYVTQGIISQELMNVIDKTSYLKLLESPRDLLSSLYLSLGFVAFNGGQLALAELFYKKSIDNARGFAEAYSNLAGVYNKSNRPRQAKTYLSIAHKINPYHPATNLNLGLIAFHGRDFKRARKLYDKAIMYRPNFFKAYILSAQLYEELKWPRKALFEYKKSLVVNPNSCSTMKKVLGFDISQTYREELNITLKKLIRKNECY